MRDPEGIFYDSSRFQVLRITFRDLGFHTPIYLSALMGCFAVEAQSEQDGKESLRRSMIHNSSCKTSLTLTELEITLS